MGMFRAIETKYKGCRFRSRSEARWAVFFDFLKIPYQYEQEAFKLPCGKMYLPDFYIVDGKVWVEVKGEYPTPEEQKKALELAQGSGKTVFIYFGGIPYSPSQLDERTMGIFAFHPNGEYGPTKDFIPWLEGEQKEVCVEDALLAARGARF